MFWRRDAFEPQPTHLRHFTRRRLRPAAARQKRCIGSKLEKWSERRDSNPRPLVPQTSALPGCATLRLGTGIRSSVFCGQEQNGLTKGKTWKCRLGPSHRFPETAPVLSNMRFDKCLRLLARCFLTFSPTICGNIGSNPQKPGAVGCHQPSPMPLEARAG